jgi:hypothetical protein
MSRDWNTTVLASLPEALGVLADLHRKAWLWRGQAKTHGCFVPSIDRDPRSAFTRLRKLELERQSIDLFRRTARFFSTEGEKGALSDDIIALMVLRHYGVPTRLLDWSRSPYVAAYFAVCDKDKDTKDGEIWSFDEHEYEQAGKAQWRRWPETTKDRSGDPDKIDAKLTAFTTEEPADWFICAFYEPGFPRQNARKAPIQ